MWLAYNRAYWGQRWEQWWYERKGKAWESAEHMSDIVQKVPTSGLLQAEPVNKHHCYLTYIWMTIRWPLCNYCRLSEVTKSDSNQGNYELTSISKLLSSSMTFCDCSTTRAWFSVTCMTNVKSFILLRVTAQPAHAQPPECEVACKSM